MLTVIKLIFPLSCLLCSICVVASEELLELHCLDAVQCQAYQHPDISATCIGGHCHCTNSKNKSVSCIPKEQKLNNIIGGPCPCTQPYSECNQEQDICYCLAHYMPSIDRRRCITEIAHLGEPCELSSQCWHQDNYAECDQDKHICSCDKGFIKHTNTCLSVVGTSNSPCQYDLDCSTSGDNAICATEEHLCVCSEGFVSAPNMINCIPLAKYNESCSSSTQCKGTLGEGGECVDKMCTCDGKHFPYETHSENDGMKLVCASIVELGQYCRNSADCYQFQFSVSEQTMDCFFGECNCKYGYNSINSGECVKGSNGVALQGSVVLLMLSSLLYI